jgi:hypothetical protein
MTLLFFLMLLLTRSFDSEHFFAPWPIRCIRLTLVLSNLGIWSHPVLPGSQVVSFILNCHIAGKTRNKDNILRICDIFDKYNVSEEDGFKVANGIVAYLEHALNDTYDTALEGGTELGEIKGYKNAINEAEEAMARITAGNLVKMSNGIELD